MAAAKHNIVLEQGVDFSLEITLKHSDGTAINLSGATFTSKIRRSPETDAIQRSGSDISFTVNITNASGGQVTFSLSDLDTAALPGDNLIYDIFRTDSAGVKYRDLEGDIEVIERITRWALLL